MKSFFFLIIVALAGCTVFSSDPNTRTLGQSIDDEAIEHLAERQIKQSNENFAGTNYDVVSFNGILLIVGQVPNETLRSQAGEAVTGLRKVKQVHNELQIGGPISMVARSNDSWLTSKVKSRLLATEDVRASRVKVVTANGVVYLMGKINRLEADQAVAATREVFGVQKIVKVFEYVD